MDSEKVGSFFFRHSVYRVKINSNCSRKKKHGANATVWQATEQKVACSELLGLEERRELARWGPRKASTLASLNASGV